VSESYVNLFFGIPLAGDSFFNKLKKKKTNPRILARLNIQKVLPDEHPFTYVITQQINVSSTFLRIIFQAFMRHDSEQFRNFL
jgi:hypothetical protein